MPGEFWKANSNQDIHRYHHRAVSRIWKGPSGCTQQGFVLASRVPFNTFRILPAGFLSLRTLTLHLLSSPWCEGFVLVFYMDSLTPLPIFFPALFSLRMGSTMAFFRCSIYFLALLFISIYYLPPPNTHNSILPMVYGVFNGRQVIFICGKDYL